MRTESPRIESWIRLIIRASCFQGETSFTSLWQTEGFRSNDVHYFLSQPPVNIISKSSVGCLVDEIVNDGLELIVFIKKWLDEDSSRFQ